MLWSYSGRVHWFCNPEAKAQRESESHPQLHINLLTEATLMTKTVEMLQARINILEQRDPVVNANIIRKLERKIRQLREFNNESS